MSLQANNKGGLAVGTASRLRLRREVERLPDTVRGLPTERAVRKAVAELNRRIADWLRAPAGPQVHVGPVDVAEVVAAWRAERPRPATPPPPEPAPERAPGKRRWWRRK